MNQDQDTETDRPDLPFVSVTMPVRNEERFIERSLGAVLAQDYPHDRLEVLIADGMSTDATREVIQNMAKQSDIPVKIIDNDGLIVPTGMNKAISAARGTIIARVDGHTIIAPDYVRQCVDVMNRTGASNVGGPMRATGVDYVTRGIALATSTPFGLGDSKFHYSDREQIVDTVYMGTFKKEALLAAGLYDERYIRHQDYELNYRIRKNGGKIFLSPRIQSIYYVRDNLGKLVKQYFQYGLWKGRMLRQSPTSVKWRHTVPVLFVLLAAVGLLTSPFSDSGRWVLFSLAGAYGAFTLIGALTTALKAGVQYLPVMPVLFAAIHFSWGVGAWYGLFQPRIRSGDG